MKPWMWAILLVAVAGPVFRYVFWLPGRMIYRWLWVHMPDGRLRTILLKKRGEVDTWPKLPPGA
jgi:hypothetical protein